ncbi:MAG: carboxypeptidase-like regulatory domain-containing protein, partial [Bacteroidota bacterium]
MKSIFTLFFCLSTFILSAQSTLKLSGKITSATDGSPVIFANIQVGGGGTSADEYGNYQFSVNAKDLNKTVSISAIGFKSKILTVKELRTQSTIILEESIFEL